MKMLPNVICSAGALAAAALLGGCAGEPSAEPSTPSPLSVATTAQPAATAPPNATSEPPSPAATPPAATQALAPTEQLPTAEAQPLAPSPTAAQPTHAPVAPAAGPTPGSRNTKLPAAAQAAADLARADLARRLGVDTGTIELLGAQPRRPDGWVIRLASGATAYTYQVDAAGRVVGRSP